MKAVVLAAGEGTRMGSLTADRPKALVDVAGQPLLAHCFDALGSLDPDGFVVVVGYRGDDVRTYFRDDYDGTPITYVEQGTQRGVAHALQQAAPQIDRDFLAMNGDNVCRANLEALWGRHRETDADATALVEKVDRETAQGTAVFADDDGEVVDLVEKPTDPPSRRVARGVWAFSPAIVPACELITPSARGEYELPDAVSLLLTAGRSLETVPLEGWCRNVNDPADVERAEKLLEDSE